MMRADFHESANSVPGYEAGGWTGLGAPVNTPSEIVATLNQHVNAALAAKNVISLRPGPHPRLDSLGLRVPKQRRVLDPDQFSNGPN